MGVFIASCALVLILPIGYAMLSNTSVGEQLNVYTKMYTGEIFFGSQHTMAYRICEEF